MHRITAIVLMVFLAVAAAGVVLTGDWRGGPGGAAGAGEAGAEPLVDVRPLRTARALAPMAGRPNEVALAQEALRVADREVDLSFAMAFRAADDQPAPTDVKTLKLLERVTRRQKRLEEAQARVAELTKAAAKAVDSRKDLLQDQLDEAEAWVSVAQDSVDDAKVDLQRAGGDRHAQIQQLKDEHDASEHQGAPAEGAAAARPAPAAPARSRGLLGRVQEWSDLRAIRKALRDGQEEARTAAARLRRQHDDLAEKLKASGAEVPAPGGATDTPPGSDESVARRARTRHLTSQQKDVLGLNRRARLQGELARIYSQWEALVAGRIRSVLHGSLLSVAALLLLALVVVATDGWLTRFFSGLGPERVRVLTIRRVARVAVESAGVVLGLLIVFGPPGQLAMLLGFAGAGLTIALKDFIVGFFGWFVLMGKDGIRVGDWVEINGVTGEVADIGPLHTVLLETGNWTDAGHPTGRRVTFVNSFAIEGHYFNFSTSGQWLWDEVVATLPPGRDPYPVVESIRTMVTRETQEMARLAEEEWTKAGHSRGLSGFSGAPSITVRPGSGGLEVVVRYVTRANERHSLRARLYQALVDLFGGGSRAAASASP